MSEEHGQGGVIDPVCTIHGKRWSDHEGGRCLCCCICFHPLTADDCATDTGGRRWDVCKGECAQEAGVKPLAQQTSDPMTHKETQPS